MLRILALYNVFKRAAIPDAWYDPTQFARKVDSPALHIMLGVTLALNLTPYYSSYPLDAE